MPSNNRSVAENMAATIGLPCGECESGERQAGFVP